MTYWLNLFTGLTWQEFQQAGARVSGFRPKRQAYVSKMQRGDVLLCYLTGVMRWVGALEVVGPSKNVDKIWSQDDFPARIDVRPLVILDADHGLPMKELEGRVDFYEGPHHAGKFKGFVRASPVAFKAHADGDLVMSMLRELERNPVRRPVDAKKLSQRPQRYKVTLTKGTDKETAVVSVPEPEQEAPNASSEAATEGTRHTEIQFELARLGAELGQDIWIARNDRSRQFQGVQLGSMDKVLSEMPTQFDVATQRTIELIDVLWLQSNSITAAFEIECTTSIYSGLLRMSDLLSLQPNIAIKLFLVAPDERRAKVKEEIVRPTFTRLSRPLAQVCGYLAFTALVSMIRGVHELGVTRSLNPSFLESMAEYFDPTGQS